MSRKKSARKQQPAPQRNLVNQPAASGRIQEGKTELLVNEVVKNPQVLQRLMDRPEVAGIMMQVTHTRSGPLPDPQELASYERISPGFAREIMDMAKAEQKHRHEHYKTGQLGAIWRDRIGQICAMVSVLVFAYIAYEMIQHAAYGWATGLLGVELVALTSVFVVGRKDRASDKKKS